MMSHSWQCLQVDYKASLDKRILQLLRTPCSLYTWQKQHRRCSFSTQHVCVHKGDRGHLAPFLPSDNAVSCEQALIL